MKIATIIGICALACATALGCSGNSPSSSSGNDLGNSGSSGSSGSSSSGNASGSGSSSSGSGSSGGGNGSGSSGSLSGSGATSGSVSGGDGGIITASPDSGIMSDEIDYSQTKTLKMDSFMVPAHGEVYYCQSFANPWGKNVDIKEYSLNMLPGSHHMFAFYQSGATDGAAAPCANGGLTFGAFTFTSQSQTLDQIYPATVGAGLPSGTGFQLMVHYLNESGSPIPAGVSLTMNIAKAGAVTNHAGVLFLNNLAMDVYTGAPAQTASYTLGQDIHVLSTDSHMHNGGSNFTATYGPSNTVLFQTNVWTEPPPKTFATPLMIPSGTKITWSCQYTVTNVSALMPLTFGESAKSNVMCISVSIFYPVADINNPVIGAGTSGFSGLGGH